jgi:hypothetical protein
LKLHSKHGLLLAVWTAVLLLSAALSAQQAATPAPIAPISSHARLLAARTIYIQHTGGHIPNDIIGDAFQGWGHYTIVGNPAQADLIVSINAPFSDAGVSVGSGNGRHSAPAPSQGSAITQIRLAILDAHDHVVLWSSSEQPKSAFKDKQREDNEVDASLRLFRRFRNIVEPEPAPAP